MNHLLAFAQRAALLIILSLVACRPIVGTPVRTGWAVDALRGRLVLLYVDRSASVADTMWSEPMQRLTAELRAGDRLLVYPIGTRAPDVPLLDTTLAGSVADRLSGELGLSTRVSRMRDSERARDLAVALRQRAAAARAVVGAAQSAIVSAICHAVQLTSANPDRRAVAVLLTDGVEESQYGNLSRGRPTPQLARRVVGAVRVNGGCAAVSEWPTIRMVGIRHRSNTQALLRWWMIVLTEMGYLPSPDDVSTHRLTPFLAASIRPQADKGPHDQ
ncbi:MAG: hypothetical protein K2R93_18885 [Gemmatimonadaceae bacterium]|nr:hypothetical protein [Gemmatimonadaceae bacterium]